MINLRSFVIKHPCRLLFPKPNKFILFDELRAKELKERREKLNLTQKELSELLNVKQNTIYRWEAEILPITRTVELAFENIENKLREQKKIDFAT